ncbi:unnamed protein product, partial [Symbiodinium necroappetens]
ADRLQIRDDMGNNFQRVGVVDNTPKVNETLNVTYTHIQVTTFSVLTEQSEPPVVEISDSISSVSNLAFDDRDLDAGDLGGTISWDIPADTSQVYRFYAYVAGTSDSTGTALSVTGRNGTAAVPPGLECHGITRSGSGMECTLERCHANHEQRNRQYVESFSPQFNTHIMPAETSIDGTVLGADNAYFVTRLEIDDTSASVSAAACPDLDLDAGEIGGIVTWTAPVTAEKDLDAGELGGRVRWKPAADVLEVTRYAVFLAEDAEGTNRSFLGYSDGHASTTFDIPAETPALMQLRLKSNGRNISSSSYAPAAQTHPHCLSYEHVCPLRGIDSNRGPIQLIQTCARSRCH